MPILLTGCAGFIGARTAHLLLEQGEEVVGIDNLNDYYDVRLKAHRLAELRQYPGFRFEPIDVEDLAALTELFTHNRFQAVINLAARAGVRSSIDNPHVYLTTNTGGTLNLLELMRRNGVIKIVMASTSSLYAGQSMPFTEELPVNTPLSPYAASKKAAEVMAYSYHHLFGIDVSVLRYFTVYGPASRPDMGVFRFIEWLLRGKPINLYGDGSQGRDFTYVDDIASGTVKALRPVGYEIINLGGGNNPVTVNEVLRLLGGMTGVAVAREEGEFHRADMQDTWADIAKAERLLGWQPEVPLAEGLARTVAWHKEHRELLAGMVL
jgi:nucleoside-diphosphate-sugar epimerase